MNVQMIIIISISIVLVVALFGVILGIRNNRKIEEDQKTVKILQEQLIVEQQKNEGLKFQLQIEQKKGEELQRRIITLEGELAYLQTVLKIREADFLALVQKVTTIKS